MEGLCDVRAAEFDDDLLALARDVAPVALALLLPRRLRLLVDLVEDVSGQGFGAAAEVHEVAVVGDAVDVFVRRELAVSVMRSDNRFHYHSIFAFG